MSVSASRRRGPTKPPEIQYISLTNWGKGRVNRNDADRTAQDALRVTENVVLDQNGTVTPRSGLKLYGTQPPGNILGQLYEFVRLNTLVTPNVPETYMIGMFVVGGVGVPYVNKNGGAWTPATGKTYSSTAKAHFEQVYGQVVVSNGVDNLSYMDVQTFAITTMTALSQPTAPTATAAAAITGSNVTLRYRYTAANQGETAGSPAGTAGVLRIRSTWNGTTEYVTVVGNRISGAQRYNIYVGDSAGNEYYLDTIADPGSGTTFTYIDTGSIAETVTRVAPAGDSTSGPKVTRVANIKGQPFMVGDSDNLGRIWFGGNIGSSALDFSSFNGGGWVEPNKGGKDFPVRVVPFRDGKGTPMAACLSRGTNGAGKRYLLQPASTTLGSTLITYMAVQEDNGADGTDSPDGVVVKNDAIWYPSRQSFKTSNTKANIQNIISTQGITDNIGGDVSNLSSLYMDNCVGLVVDQQIFWAVPFNATTNNQIWVLDLRQKGAWMTPLYIAADWMMLYADNSDGKTKVIMVVNNQIYEYDAATATNDNGTAFSTNIGSGDIKAVPDGSIWMSVIDVTFVFLRPQGNINLSVNANTEDGLVSFTDTLPGSSSQSNSAWGRYGWGGSGWGQLAQGNIPISTATPRRQWTIPVDEEVNSLSWGVNTVDIGVSYQLAEVIVRYVAIGYRELDNE